MASYLTPEIVLSILFLLIALCCTIVAWLHMRIAGVAHERVDRLESLLRAASDRMDRLEAVLRLRGVLLDLDEDEEAQRN